MPYNPPSPLEPLVVTSPATHVSSYPTAETDGWVIRNGDIIETPEADILPAEPDEPTPAPELPENETVEPEPTDDAPVSAAGTSELEELEPPEPSPELTETETPEAEETETPTPTATPDAGTPDNGSTSDPRPATTSAD